MLGIPGTNGSHKLDGGYPAFDIASAIGAGNAADSGAFTNLGNQNNSLPDLAGSIQTRSYARQPTLQVRRPALH